MTHAERALYESLAPAFESLGHPEPPRDSADLWSAWLHLWLLRQFRLRGWPIPEGGVWDVQALVRAASQSTAPAR